MKHLIPVILVLCLLSLSGCAKKDKHNKNSTEVTNSVVSNFTSIPSGTGDSGSLGSQNPGPVEGPHTMVILSNTTNKEFIDVYLRPNGSTEWRQVANSWKENNFVCDLSASDILASENWDVRMIDQENEEYIWRNINMKVTTKIDIAYENGQASFVYR